MRIFFVDGGLDDYHYKSKVKKALERIATQKHFLENECEEILDTVWFIEATNGYIFNSILLDFLVEAGNKKSKIGVLTDCTYFLNTKYCWNNQLDSLELYMYKEDIAEFVEAQALLNCTIEPNMSLSTLFFEGSFGRLGKDELTNEQIDIIKKEIKAIN